MPKKLTIDELLTTADLDLGSGPWMSIAQDRITRFAMATGDEQWIHIDEKRAANSPFGGTIAHGYLTLSLVTHLIEGLVHIDDVSMIINYGIDKLRYPAVVSSGSEVRLHAKFLGAEEKPSGVLYRVAVEIEIKNAPRPALVATLLFLAVR